MSRRPRWWLTILAAVWPITWLSARATRLPIIGGVVAALSLPLFSKKNLNVSYIPINETMEGTQSSFLPREAASELIRRSGHRVIIERCTCRDDRTCTEHPIDYGCTLLGEGTKEIDPRIARHVTVDEALAHLDRTLADGLIPMIGRVKIDNLIWGVKDRGKLLTICHCCRCCCTILNSGKYLPDEAARSLVRLEGLLIDIDTNACVRCGACIDECFMGSLTLEGDRVVRNEETCKGCGRCVTVCPHDAVSIHIDDMDRTMNELMGRIEGLIDYR